MHIYGSLRGRCRVVHYIFDEIVSKSVTNKFGIGDDAEWKYNVSKVEVKVILSEDMTGSSKLPHAIFIFVE